MRLLVPIALLAGCPAQDPAEEAVPPTVSFLSPADGATVPAGDVAVSLIVEDFELVDPPTTARWRSPLAWVVPVAEAHDEDGLATGFCVLSLDGAEVARIGTTQHTLTGVAAGAHTLACELVYEDGDSLEPAVSASVSFTAE